MEIKSILVPVDFSSSNGESLQLASILAQAHGATLHIVHVQDDEDLKRAFGTIRCWSEKSWQDERSLERGHLEELRPFVATIPCVHRVLAGTASDEIVNYATRHNIDLIVMGSHGRSGIRRAILGSVAEQVMRKSPCSVLVVRASDNRN
jgi:nucleotide-binding universal stress UspA family protein